ncbi:immediate early response gene 2 protein-like [Terrapene carolina triunguis]|uniref:immediate early response gene 2 protein-like n=1 Tax=Terrapene triunguis TaxID=2587831 RepID=UPI000E775CF4|nr:immediate early response gene 2 protein-like [Terrapene carolina triunguis]
MEVQKEAQRIMTLSVWKMYNSRLQRGGLRLHRSLQLSLVMRSAREVYLSAKLEEDEEGRLGPQPCLGEEGAGQPPLPPAAASPGPPAPEERAAPVARGNAPRAVDPEPMETQDSSGDLPPAAPAPGAGRRPARGVSLPPPGKASRKRRSSSLDKPGAAEAGLVPTKKARLEAEEEEGERQPQGQDGPFPSLAKVLQTRFSGMLRGGPPKGPEPTPGCRPGDGVLSILVRAVVAF